MFRYAHKLEVQRTDGVLSQLSPLPHLYSVSYYQLSEELARAYPELTLAIFSGMIIELVNSFSLATILRKTTFRKFKYMKFEVESKPNMSLYKIIFFLPYELLTLIYHDIEIAY